MPTTSPPPSQNSKVHERRANSTSSLFAVGHSSRTGEQSRNRGAKSDVEQSYLLRDDAVRVVPEVDNRDGAAVETTSWFVAVAPADTGHGTDDDADGDSDGVVTLEDEAGPTAGALVRPSQTSAQRFLALRLCHGNPSRKVLLSSSQTCLSVWRLAAHDLLPDFCVCVDGVFQRRTESSSRLTRKDREMMCEVHRIERVFF